MVRIMLRTLAAALATALLLVTACSEKAADSGESEGLPKGRTTGSVGCKSLQAGATVDSEADQACVEYEYDGVAVLKLKHVNAIFNCCPDSVGGEIRIENNTIVIDEAEWLTLPCDCVCPFDVDYEIVDLPPGEYTIRVNELYQSESAELLEFTVDLVASPEGAFCVPRDLPVVSGIVTDYTGCKTFDAAAERRDAPTSQDCIEYEYDGESILRLTHVNAGFNCCPDSFTAEFHTTDTCIVIDEIEWLSAPCHCLCLFDVEYKLFSVSPQHYILAVNEPYKQEGDQMLESTIDLATSPSGVFCVDRDHYPWGAE